MDVTTPTPRNFALGVVIFGALLIAFTVYLGFTRTWLAFIIAGIALVLEVYFVAALVRVWRR
jgi:uncharacterized membrane protein